MAREMIPSISSVICCWQPTAAGSGEDSEVKTAATSLGWRPMARRARSRTSSTRSAGCSSRGGCWTDPGVEHLDPVHERGRQEVVLAGEVAVHRAHGHVGAGRDVAHLDRLVAALEPQRHGGVDDALAPGLLGAGERAGQRLLHPDSVSAPSPGSSGTGPLRWPAMPGQSPGREAAVVPLDAYAEPVATTDGRVPGRTGPPDPPAPARRHGRAPDAPRRGAR